MKTSLTIIITLLLSLSSEAQMNSTISKFTVGAKVQTNGIGLASSGFFHQTESKNHGFSLDVSTLHHVREVKIRNENQINTKAYVFGKQYRAFNVNPSYQLMFNAGKSGRAASSLAYGIEIGPSFAFLRPVYLLMIDFDQNENMTPTVEAYNPVIHTDQDEIIGDAGWEKGFSEMRVKGGIHFAAFINMDWDQNYFRKRLRSGISIDYFFNDLEIMYKNQNQLFTSLFVAYQFGKNQ